MDKPDFKRKAHFRPIPRIGGVPLAVAYFAGFIVLSVGGWTKSLGPHDPSSLMVRALPALLIIFAIGLVDDLQGLSPWRKLAGQSLAALYACSIGIRFVLPPGSSAAPTAVSIVATIFWLVLCVNAFNLIDGLDGLAAGAALISSTALLTMALIHHNVALAMVITPLIGALLGFLFYNFNPASIFLGDCGSLLVGFLLGCYSLLWTQQAGTDFARVAPLVALSLPVFEVAYSIFRRFLRKQPLFGSDRDHIHHRVVRLGLSHRNAALTLYVACSMAAGAAVLLTLLRPERAMIVLLIAGGVAAAGFCTLRYAEVAVLGTFLFAGELRQSLCIAIQLREFEVALATSTTVEECWTALKHICHETRFSYVSLKLATHQFEATLCEADEIAVERLSVTLSATEEATFEYGPAARTAAIMIAPLIERLQKQLICVDPGSPCGGPTQVQSGIPQARAATVR